MKFFQKTLVIFVLAFSYIVNAQQGMIKITVNTNINSFKCECREINYICKENTENEVLLIPVASFNCPKRMIEKDLRELFEAEKYPEIQLSVHDLTKDELDFFATIKLKIKQKESTYCVKLDKLQEDGNKFYSGNLTIRLTEFNLKPPVKALGMVKVQDEVEIAFKIPAIYLL